MANQCTKFEDPGFNRSRNILGGLKFKMIHVTRQRPFQVWFVISGPERAMITIHTKFEVPLFTLCKDTMGNARRRNWSGCGFGWLGVTQGHQ